MEKILKRMKYFNANQIDVCCLRRWVMPSERRVLFLYVSHKCEIIIEFVYCSRVCLRYQNSRLIYIIYARFTPHDVVDNDTQFLHSSITIEACKVDTLINRNAMHILYFIITSFAYVGNIFYRYALQYALIPHTLAYFSHHPFREVYVNKNEISYLRC